MPRKKAAEVEILAPEDQSARGRKKLVEAEHTIKYSAPVPVTVEEDPDENNLEEDIDFVEEEKARRRKKTAKDERDDLRREMDKLGVASVSRLKLSIDKYRNSDSDESGTLAEKDYCEKYPVTKEHILNDDYMAIARKYGPGRYWFTLRMDNKIVRQWERQVNQALTPSGPVIQHVNPNDPTSPQVIYQSINGDGQAQQVPMSIKDIMKTQREALKEQLEMAKLMREAYGFAPEQPQQESKSEEEIIAGAIIKQPHVIETVVESIIKRVGKSNGESDAPWWADPLKDAITSGQLAPTVQGIVKALFPNGLFGGLFPGGNNNGQAQMATAPIQNQTAPGTDQQQRSEFVSSPQESLQQGASQMGSPQALAGGTSRDVEGVVLASNESQMAITPEEAALRTLIDNCMRKVPAQIAFDRLMAYADAVNEQYPQGSIDGYIEMLGSAPTDAVIEYVKGLPGGEQVIALPHTQEWCAELQRLIKESQEGDE